MNIELAKRIFEDADHPLREQARDVLRSHPETSFEMAVDRWLAEWIVVLFCPYPTFSVSSDDIEGSAEAIAEFYDIAMDTLCQALLANVLPSIESGELLESFEIH